jgi:hypothetical protein
MIEQISALLEESHLIAYATAIKQTIIPERKLENVETRNQACSQKPSP